MSKKEDCKFDIRLIENDEESLIDVKANNKESVLTALAVFVKELRIHGQIEEHKLKYAFNLGLGKDEKPNVQVKEIHITKENEKEFKELLKKLTGEGK